MVVAPAAVPEMAAVERGMALLREWGYEVREARHLRARYRYTAGTAAQRSADLIAALSEPGIDCVWLARGGYGCAHCLPLLPDALPRERMVVGFSDATALFCALYARGHTRLVHGPMVECLGGAADAATMHSLQALLATPAGSAPPARHRLAGRQVAGLAGSVRAPLIGGNLAVLASMAGTPWALRGAGAIVLLEEITEQAYRMDRMIVQLLASGFFDGVRAILLGDFVRCSVPADSQFTIAEMLVDLLAPLGVPIVEGVEVGHGARNLSWIVGATATLQDGSVDLDGAARLP